ncbi:MAG: hypothetical protein FWD33_01755 [Alphaproteobacteria bacterium]|nr:hypothetical protein [Alphaproteobacteria bacterium]
MSDSTEPIVLLLRFSLLLDKQLFKLRKHPKLRDFYKDIMNMQSCLADIQSSLPYCNEEHASQILKEMKTAADALENATREKTEKPAEPKPEPVLVTASKKPTSMAGLTDDEWARRIDFYSNQKNRASW